MCSCILRDNGPCPKCAPKRHAVFDIFDMWPQMTDAGISWTYRHHYEAKGWPIQSERALRARRKELVDAGMLKDSGLRLLGLTHRPNVMWERS